MSEHFKATAILLFISVIAAIHSGKPRWGIVPVGNSTDHSMCNSSYLTIKVGIDGIESMVSIYFSMIFRFEKCHRYIKHVSNFEPKNFDTQSESSLKHRYQKASIDFEIFFVYTSSESSQFYRYQRACIVFEAQIFDTLP